MKKKVIAGVSLLLLVVISFVFRNYFLYAFYDTTLDVSYPSNISMTHKNDALIVDSGAKRIVKLSPNGTYSLKIEASALTFHNARGVCEDAAGEKIYVSDVVWASNGMDIVQESIQVFDQHGKYETSLLVREHKERTPRPTLFGPFLSDATLYVAEISQDCISVIDLQRNVVHQTISYPDANLRISSIAMQKDRVFLVDKSGVILEWVGDEGRVCYHGSETDISVPWQIASSDDGRVFFTDLAKREVLELKKDGSVCTSFAAGEGEDPLPFAEQQIYYPISVSGVMGTVYRNQVFLKQVDGTVLQNESQFHLSSAATVQKVVWIAVLVVMCTLALYLAISGIIALSHISVWKLSSKLSFVIVFVIVTMMLIVLPITYSQGKSMYIDSTMDHLSAVVDMGGKFIDTDALANIKSPSDYMGEDYMKLSQSLRQIVNKDAKYGESLYCLLYQENDGILYTPIFLDGTGGAYYPYDYTSQDTTLNEVFRQGKLVETGLSKGSSGTWMFVQGPIYGENNEVIGAIEVGIDMNSYQQTYNKMYTKIIFSVIAAAIILQMVLMQLLDMGDFLKKRKEKRMNLREPIEFIGPLTFLMFFAFNLITAFIPVYAMRLYEPVMGLPKEFMGALPISLNLLALVGGCAVSGALIGKYGIRNIGTIGSLVTIVSYVSLAFLQNYYMFTLLFVLAGFGSGIMQNTVYAYIATTQDKEEESRGFTSYNSALFIGFNCGTVIGAQVADRFGYAVVFLVTAVIFALTGLCMWKFMKSDTRPEKEEKTQYHIFQFLFTPKIFLFFLCALIPFTISNHFLFYFMPVYGETLGLTETLIGQLFLINGVCILMFSDILTSITQKYLKDRMTIFIAMSIIILAFLLFTMKPSLMMIIVVLILLGIASSFGAAAVRTYYTNQEHTAHYGKEKAMSVFATMENAGDTVGPMVFSFMLVGVLRLHFLILVGVMVVCTLVFAISSK